MLLTYQCGYYHDIQWEMLRYRIFMNYDYTLFCDWNMSGSGKPLTKIDNDNV